MVSGDDDDVLVSACVYAQPLQKIPQLGLLVVEGVVLLEGAVGGVGVHDVATVHEDVPGGEAQVAMATVGVRNEHNTNFIPERLRGGCDNYSG